MKKILFIIGLVFLASNLSGKVSESTSDSLVHLLKLSKGEEKASLLISICNGYYDSQPQEAKNFAQQLIRLGQTENKKIWIIKGYYAIALADYYHADLTEAYLNFDKSYRLSEEIKNDSTAVLALNSMAVIKARLGHFDLAIRHFREIGKKALKADHFQGYVSSLMNLGNCYYEMNKTDSALIYYHQGYLLSKQYNLEISMVTFGINMADIEKSKGNLNKAKVYLVDAAAMSRKINNLDQLLTCLISLSEIELKAGRFIPAEEYAKEALLLAKKTNARDEIMSANQALYEIKQSMNNPSEALKYYKEYVHVKDSIFNDKVQHEILTLSTKYENEKKEKIILEQEKDIQKAHIQNIVLLIILFFLIFILISGVIVYKRRNKMLLQLVEKNIEAMEAEKQSNILMENSCFKKPVIEEKYKKSTLSSSSKEIIEIEFINMMNEEKLWRQGDITLEKIANKLNTNTKYLSQIINQTYHQSFPNFINELRVKEARCMLVSKEYNHYTIEAIGQMTGFNSNSSFVMAFKRYTGLTPSFFRNSRKHIA